MKKILVYNQSFSPISETFIYNQVMGLAHENDVEILGHSFLNENIFKYNLKKLKIESGNRILKNLFSRFKAFDLTYVEYKSIKKLISDRKYDAIHVHFGTNAVKIFPIIKLLNIPLIISFHGIDASYKLGNHKVYKKKLQEVFSYACSIVIVSPHMIETLNLHQWLNKVTLLPYGVDINYFKNRELNKIKTNEKIKILHSGRLVAKKGVYDLIKVFKELTGRFDNLVLEIIGDGPELNRCQKFVISSELSDKVVFMKSQPHTVVLSKMYEADIFVLNSRTAQDGDMEGLPNAILEAMSIGLPVVTTKHAGIEQAVQNNYNGLVVEEYNNTALYKSIEELILNELLRRDLSINARKTIVEKFTIEKMQTGLNSILKTAIEKNMLLQSMQTY